MKSTDVASAAEGRLRYVAPSHKKAEPSNLHSCSNSASTKDTGP
ncbi:hypothetical protein [Streptomyces regalis]|nr:hypothetical protein [Streptomyces regalis]